MSKMQLFKFIALIIYASSCYSETTWLNGQGKKENSNLFESVINVSPELEKNYIEALSQYHKVKRARLVRVKFELLDKLTFGINAPTKINLNLFDGNTIPLFLHERYTTNNTVYITGGLSEKLDSRYFIQLIIYNANKRPRHLSVSFFDRLAGLERIRINLVPHTAYHYIANVESKYSNENTPLAQIINASDNSFGAATSTFIDHSIIDIHFVNDTLGYAIGNALAVYKTIDGGIQWKIINTKFIGYHQTLHFVNEQEGIIGLHDVTGCPKKCQHRASASITSDGGESWAKIQYPNLSGSFREIISGSPGILFASLVQYQPATLKILKSENNGISWEIIYEDLKLGLSDRHFKWNEDILYLVTRHSSILKISKEGRLIDETPFIGTGYIDDLIILSPNIYLAQFINGSNVRLIKTIDGGKNWSEVYQSDKQDFRVIMVKSIDNFALIKVTEQDTGPSDLLQPTTDVILLTKDGGISWSESEKLRNLTWHVKPHTRQTFESQSLVLSGDRVLHIYHE